MVAIPSQQPEYYQKSFIGGMRLSLDDTNLDPTQYRIGFNLRNRFDRLDAVKSSIQDAQLSSGVIQEVTTFGNYQIAFVSGSAYYKLFSSSSWNLISAFSGKLSPTAPRYWTVAIPVSTTNYLRIAATKEIDSVVRPDGTQPVIINNLTGAFLGTLPGLLVQDNISQPVFIFINTEGVPDARIVQSFTQWSITFTDENNTTIAPDGDKREYVPIGNCMAWVDGVLYVVSQDFNSIYRSVSGRPLDLSLIH